MMLLPTLIVHLSYFRRKPLSSGGLENNKGLAPFTALFLCCCSGPGWLKICCVTNFLCFFTLEIEFILMYFHLFISHKALSWAISEASKSILPLWSFCLAILQLLSIMPIDSRTRFARIGVFQSTKIVTQPNSFQTPLKTLLLCTIK